MPWNGGEAWTKAWRRGLRGSQQGLDDQGAPGELWGLLPSGVDAGELRTGEGRLKHTEGGGLYRLQPSSPLHRPLSTTASPITTVDHQL